jgi:branched-chain amino acid transport system substrate-binding protein
MRTWSVVLGLCVALLSSSMAGAEETVKPESIKIGGLFAITGGASFLGKPEADTVEMLAEQLNAAGGINGVPVEVIIKDTGGDPQKTIAAATELITKDKVVVIVGPSRSGSSMAIVPIVTHSEVPLISCAAAEVIVSPVEQRKWVFKTPQKDSQVIRHIYMKMKQMGLTKAGILSGTTGFGGAGRKQLIELAEKMGIEIVADETYAPAATDMTAQLTKIKASGAEAVINWSIVPAQSIVPKNMKQLRMEIPLFQSHGFGNIAYAEACGPAGEGIMFPAGRILAVEDLPANHPQKAPMLKYKQDYEARFKEPVSTFGGHAYDAFMIAVEAIKKVDGEVTRAKVRDAIEQVKGFAGTGGVFNFSDQDHNGLGMDSLEWMVVKDGKFRLLSKPGE